MSIADIASKEIKLSDKKEKQTDLMFEFKLISEKK